MTILRRDFLKGLAAVPFLTYFAFGFKQNINKKVTAKRRDMYEVFKISKLQAPQEKLILPTGKDGKKLRFGLIGNGWRGEALLQMFGYVHPDFIEKNLVNDIPSKKMQNLMDQEDLNAEFVAVCDVFDVHTQRGVEISQNNLHLFKSGDKQNKCKVYSSYREMVADKDIDAVIICTPDHTHAPMAIAAANAGKHVFLEKPMTHSIEEAVELKRTIKSTGVVFQLGHSNRQQMSFKIAKELYEKGVLGDVTQVRTFTNRNTIFGAWIRDDAWDHSLGNESNINWEEFLGNAPWHEFDLKRFFSWQRYDDYGTSITGNDFSHYYDRVNQILGLGIPHSVVAQGGQYYYKTHGDMPDVFNAIFSYPERGLTLTYDASLKNGVYAPAQIFGSEATMDIDTAILIFKDPNSEKYKNIKVKNKEPIYYYEPSADVDAVSTATSKEYIQGGHGPTFIDGKVLDVTYLHVKEWVDAIRGHGKVSCTIDDGFEEAVTFNMANLAYLHKKPVTWDAINEKAIIG